MALYIRYSNDIQKDLEKGYSYHYTGADRSWSVEDVENGTGLSIDELEYNEDADMWVQPLAGLCAFSLETDDLSNAIEKAQTFRYNDVYNSDSMKNWHIVSGNYEDGCPEGDCIVNVELLHSNEQ